MYNVLLFLCTQHILDLILDNIFLSDIFYKATIHMCAKQAPWIKSQVPRVLADVVLKSPGSSKIIWGDWSGHATPKTSLAATCVQNRHHG